VSEQLARAIVDWDVGRIEPGAERRPGDQVADSDAPSPR
jgi:hypothetical protein